MPKKGKPYDVGYMGTRMDKEEEKKSYKFGRRREEAEKKLKRLQDEMAERDEKKQRRKKDVRRKALESISYSGNSVGRGKPPQGL